MKTNYRSTMIMLVALAIAPGLMTGSARADDPDDLDAAFEHSLLIIETAANGCFRFDVHVAASRQQHQRGLMFVRELPPWSGMIFVYPKADVLSMWMKNTYIPLDILFARDDGRVSSVAANTEPLSLRSISAIEPVRYVLELNAGTAARLGIDEGSTLLMLDQLNQD